MAGFSRQTPPISTNTSTQSSSMLLQWVQEKAFHGPSFSNCDPSAHVLVCAVAPLWRRQMDWESPYLPEEAVYGSSLGESMRSLKFSFPGTAINPSRGVRIEPAPELVCQGRRASRRQSSCQRLCGTKAVSSVSRVANKWPNKLTVRNWK